MSLFKILKTSQPRCMNFEKMSSTARTCPEMSSMAWTIQEINFSMKTCQEASSVALTFEKKRSVKRTCQEISSVIRTLHQMSNEASAVPPMSSTAKPPVFLIKKKSFLFTSQPIYCRTFLSSKKKFWSTCTQEKAYRSENCDCSGYNNVDHDPHSNIHTKIYIYVYKNILAASLYETE